MYTLTYQDINGLIDINNQIDYKINLELFTQNSYAVISFDFKNDYDDGLI